MKYHISVKIHYNQNDVPVIETYASLKDCASHYNLNTQTLKSIIYGHSRLTSKIPDGATFELQPINADVTPIWKCECCNVSIKRSSKSNHLNSQKHIEKSQSKD